MTLKVAGCILALMAIGCSPQNQSPKPETPANATKRLPIARFYYMDLALEEENVVFIVKNGSTRPLIICTHPVALSASIKRAGHTIIVTPDPDPLELGPFKITDQVRLAPNTEFKIKVPIERSRIGKLKPGETVSGRLLPIALQAFDKPTQQALATQKSEFLNQELRTREIPIPEP